jgi:hypothetical protein
MKNDVWEVVPRPKEKRVVTSKWVYNIKHAIDGSIDKYKAIFVARGFSCYPRYLGITRRSCLEAHMVLDMEYREQERLEHGPGGPIFLLLSQTCPVSSTSFHHYRPGLASERTLAP